MPDSPPLDSSAAPPAPAAPRIGADIDYGRFLDCVHCGLCTAACPTYLETGNENDSPRGRIYLMRAVTDGRLELGESVKRHLDLCLDCRSCETACPSGVQYGRLIEPFRVDMRRAEAEQSRGAGGGSKAAGGPSWLQRMLLYGLFPYSGRMKVALAPARWLQRTGLDRCVDRSGLPRLLPGFVRRMYDQLPRLQPSAPTMPEFLPAIGPRRARVGLFAGCVAQAMFPQTNWATARVLQANGCDVFVPRSQGCCGAIHYHSGAAGPALEFAARNAAAFDVAKLDAVIVNVAGCGSMLKDYGHIAEEAEHTANGGAPSKQTPGDKQTPSENITDEQAASATRTERVAKLAGFASKVRDVSEFLAELGLVPPPGQVRLRAVYHDACHLVHAQRVREQPRSLLAMIPGLELVPLAESEVCCGAAGSYNLTEPEMSERLSQRKLRNILACDPQAVITGNAGCSLQIQTALRRGGSPIWVAHPMDVLDLSYRNARPPTA
jgi:glycolate oxidase iron-sulfur subunit